MGEAKTLGLGILIALVVGNMVGSGIFLLPSSLAQFGSISLLAWIFTSIGAILIAIVFSRLSILLPKAGGPYAYCREAFGGFVGFLIAYMYWIYSWVGNAAIATSMVSYLSYFFPVIATNNFISFSAIVALIWILTIINIMGVGKAGKLQVVTVVLKIIPLIAISFLGVAYIHPGNFAAFNLTHQSNFAALSGSAILTLWALTGVESATVPAEHVINPKKNIPRATIIGTMIAIILYVMSTIVIMGIIPMQALATSTAPFADAAKMTIGTLGGAIIAIAAIISSVGALNGWILLQGQVPYAASKDKVFPAIFSGLSKYNTPVNSLIISSGFITILLIMNYQKSLIEKFTSIITLATIFILIVYCVTMVAEIVMLRQQKIVKNFGRKITVNILAMIYIIWALYGCDRIELFHSVLLALTGIPIYLYTRWKNTSVPTTYSIEKG
jgi:APA family basic amino acid/polyamine antiporter